MIDYKKKKDRPCRSGPLAIPYMLKLYLSAICSSVISDTARYAWRTRLSYELRKTPRRWKREREIRDVVCRRSRKCLDAVPRSYFNLVRGLLTGVFSPRSEMLEYEKEEEQSSYSEES